MGKNIKLPLEAGFTALCNHIKAIKATAEQSGSAVAYLADAVATSLGEVDAALGGKQDKVNAVSVTIETAEWSADTVGPYKFCYDIPVAGLTVKDRADIALAPASVKVATSCGLCPTTETLAGKIRLRAISKPTVNIAAEYWLTGGKE